MLGGFFLYLIWGAFFFLGIAGVGIWIFEFLKLERQNIFFKIAIAYFFSLCLYVLLAVATLWTFPNKQLALFCLTGGYLLLSFWTLSVRIKKKGGFRWLQEFLKEQRSVFLIILSTFFLFFLLIYQTSILDEWLHRPIVKYFIANGEFPFKNPLNPSSDFIYFYHYGMHVVACAFDLFSHLGASVALDLVKGSYFFASFFLFYGIILFWTNKQTSALLGTILIIFCGSSFFLMDAFTTSHFYKIKWLQQAWLLNAPLALVLTGLTWVNIPLVIAFSFSLEDIFYKNIKKLKFSHWLLLMPLLVGFFLISELFAVVIILSIGFLVFLGMIRYQLNFVKTILQGLGFIFFIGCGVYLTGGVPGKLLHDFFSAPKKIFIAKTTSMPESDAVVISTVVTPKIIELRPISKWGYAEESGDPMPINKYFFFYLRSFFLEASILFLLAFLLIKKKVVFSEMPLTLFLLPIFFIGPFIFSSSFGDLNLYKLTVAGIIFLHLIGFYLLTKVKSSFFYWAFIGLFLLGALPGIALGFNIQWGLFSGKGGQMRCSQNPLCYKEDVIKMFNDFEKAYPGKKVFLVRSSGDAEKVVDLTNSSVITVDFNQIQRTEFSALSFDYIFTSNNLPKALELLERESYKTIFQSGKYRIIEISKN